MRRILGLKIAAAVLLAGLALPGAGRAAAPARVVSFNLCADQLAMALADPQQIAGLSPYAVNPALSVLADKARAFRKLDWQAEATIPLKPDLVFVGSWDRSATRRMLVRLGFRVVEVGLVSDLKGAQDQIREIASLLGHPERGEALIAALNAAHARVAGFAPLRYRTALVIERGGFTAGSDTLAATLLRAAGLQPPSGAPAGFGGFLPLERLLLLQPNLVFLKDPPAQPDDQGALYFTHPALKAAYPPERRIALPTRFTMCGGPALVAAFDYLAGELARLKAN